VIEEIVTIEKLVHGGQGIGTLADGRRVFAWNVLPGEKVTVRLTKSKHKLAEGVAEEISVVSPEREQPRDEAYLSTSPWQMMSFAAENTYKQAIFIETIQREHVAYDAEIPMIAGREQWHYRNKMEYSFWADDSGLHLALFNRGTHGKIIVPGSSIAAPAVDQTANKILAVLNKHGIRGSQLKTVIVRSNQKGDTVAALFCKDQAFPELPELADICRGVVVYYSNPKSPASIISAELYAYGDKTLTDTINGTDITYDVNSFFQVNLEIFSIALQQIKEVVGSMPFIDMYSGVGTIGLSIGGAATLVEADAHNTEMAQHNSQGTIAQVVQATAETALEYIDNEHCLIVDPPRAGLHAKVVDQIIVAKPPQVVYLSCNPITQARDLALLQGNYKISQITGYNFFPRTPHIESLAVLERL
jgi:23S rRNA (uracil1939-C5)-methyltransferase